ncbi:MAG: DUF5606 domain-containing protein [Flavobacteriales bacterium]|nr:DUF5606 domain-containing protein [Flavobacteriales bacterium]
MVIQEIIAIAGKPGLYRIIVTNRANLVVESMLDKKRISIPGTSRISSLADITMYTTGEDVLLMDVLNRIADKTGDSEVPSSKAEMQVIRDFVDGIIPELDGERVYNSDLKKLIQWFSILRTNSAFPLESEVVDDEPEEGATEKSTTVESSAKKPAAKKAAAKKPTAKKPGSKKSASTVAKPTAKKTAIKKSAAKGSKAK